MITIGYQASHEQFSPSALLDYVKLAQDCGFGLINSSDHFFPWSTRQGQSGFTFAWLGAAMQLTSLPFTSVCAPGQRYHPAIVAQAIATLAEMFPGRYNIALGSGEALNECITGELWPQKEIRNQRLLECATVMRKLLSGEYVNYKGLVEVAGAKLYTLPSKAPLLLGAALSVPTAEWMGSWADGLITTASSRDQAKDIIAAFRNTAGANKPVYLKVQLAYAESDEAAMDAAFDQWRNNIFQGSVLGELRTVEQFDALGELVQKKDLQANLRISSSLAQHTEWLLEDMNLDINYLILHQVGRNQTQFLEDFGNKVLQVLKSQQK